MARDLLTKEEILEYLEDLATELSSKGVTATIYVVGGAAMVVAFDARPSTRDVDAAYSPEEVVEEVADEIGIRHDIGIDWLNNDAVQFFPLSIKGEVPALTLHNGTVTIEFASARTLMAMKMNSGRRRDRRDIEYLRKHLRIAPLEDAVAIFDEMYSGKQLKGEALDLLTEIFAEPLDE